MRSQSSKRAAISLTGLFIVSVLAPVVSALVTLTPVPPRVAEVCIEGTGSCSSSGIIGDSAAELIGWGPGRTSLIWYNNATGFDRLVSQNCNQDVCFNITVATLGGVGTNGAGQTWCTDAVGPDGFGVIAYTKFGGLRFVKTTNHGATWSTPVVVSNIYDGGSFVGQNCGIDAVSTSNIYVVYTTTSASIGFKQSTSTDGGATWVSVDLGGYAGFGGIEWSVAHKTGTPGEAVAIEGGMTADSGLLYCRTFDNFLSSTCGYLPTGVKAQNPRVKYVPGTTGTYYITAVIGSGVGYGDIVLCKTTNTMSSVECNTATNPRQGLSAAGMVNLAVLDEDTAFICVPGVGTWSQVNDTVDAFETSPAGYVYMVPNGEFTGDITPHYATSKYGGDFGSAGGVYAGAHVAPDATGYCSFSFVERRDYFTDMGPAVGDVRRVETVRFRILPTVGPAATADITTLVDFDVDRDGSILIARHAGGGRNVTTFNAQPLGTAIATQNTACVGSAPQQNGGVLSQGGLVAYTKCDETTDPTFMRISTLALGAPTITDFNGCSPTICDRDISLDDFSEGGSDGVFQAGEIQEFPIDYQTGRALGLVGNVQSRVVAWAWTGRDAGVGQVGVNVFSVGEIDGGEERHNDVESMGSGVPSAICTGVDGSDFYLGVVHADQNTRMYPVTFGTEFAGQPGVTVTMGSPAQFSGPYAGASDIDCNDDRMVFAKYVSSTEATIYGVERAGSFLWSRQVAADVSGDPDVAISEVVVCDCSADGQQFAAWTNGGFISVGYANNGTELGNLSVPDGLAIRQMHMDRTGQSLWAGTLSHIYRWSISNLTTGSPVITDPGGPPPTSTTAPGVFDSASFGSAFGLGSFAGGLIISALLILGIAAVGFFGIGRSPIGATFGAFGGFLMSWGFGTISTAAVFVVVVVLGALVFLGLRNRG